MSSIPRRATPRAHPPFSWSALAFFAGVVAAVGAVTWSWSLVTAVALLAGMTLGMSGAAYWSIVRTAEVVDDLDRAGGAGTAPLDDLLRHCEEPLVLTDVSLRVRYANDAFFALCDRTIIPEANSTILDALVHRIADSEAFARTAAGLLTHPEREATGELTRLTTPARTFDWRSVPLRAADGRVVGRGFLFHDRSQARELAGLKTDFLSTVTHELRTPLTSVKGSLQLVLGKSTALSPIDCELLHISLKNADRLIRLINDLLDISRLELGKIELTFAKVPTASLIEEAVAGLRAYAAGRDITIGCAVTANVPAIEGDRDRLIQVLTNLVSNAVKFSPAGGRVLVSADACEDQVHIAVRDWGIGIPVADQSRLFQRFQRLNSGHSDEPSSGLGLAISKAIVERHGGRIVLESREREGSTFTIAMPAAKQAPASVPARDETGRATPTVLLVDDDDDLDATLRQAWDGRFQLQRVARGLDALDAAREMHPDVVLLDVVLPDLSGYDVLRILRTTAATATIPVILLTGQAERAVAANLGAVDVVKKPLDLDQLTAAVGNALAERGGTMQLHAAVAS